MKSLKDKTHTGNSEDIIKAFTEIKNKFMKNFQREQE